MMINNDDKEGEKKASNISIFRNGGRLLLVEHDDPTLHKDPSGVCISTMLHAN